MEPPPNHQFTHQNCATLLRNQRSKILVGCSFCFSGIFPSNSKMDDIREIQWIKRLGGQIDESVIPNKTTHLIARDPKTDKVIEAVFHNMFVVHMDWLWFTVWYNSRADEKAVSLKNIPSHEESISLMDTLMQTRAKEEADRLALIEAATIAATTAGGGGRGGGGGSTTKNDNFEDDFKDSDDSDNDDGDNTREVEISDAEDSSNCGHCE
jgi:hypothetical protein